MYCALLSSVQRLPECPFEEKLLFEQFVVRSLRDLHQPARGEHQAPPPTRRVPDCPVDLRTRQGGRLCPKGVHRETVGDRVSLIAPEMSSVY